MNISDKNLYDYRLLALSAAYDLEYPEWVIGKIRSAKSEDEVSSVMAKVRLSESEYKNAELIEDHIIPKKLVDRFWESKNNLYKLLANRVANIKLY